MAIADSSTVALPLTVMIALDVPHQDLDCVTKILSALSEITWLATTTGQFDIIALAQFRSMDELNQFIRRTLTTVEGVKNSETFVCLQIDKRSYLLGAEKY